jgi:hypothetical protein
MENRTEGEAMEYRDLCALREAMIALGVDRLYAKPLSENDNSKQQIYLGGSFDAVNRLPSKSFRQDGNTYKADLDFNWLNPSGRPEPAKAAKLILYPDYPEVRFSGFLLGCKTAPSKHLQPIPKANRKGAGPDGRHLVIGVTSMGVVHGYLALPTSVISREIRNEVASGRAIQSSVFIELQIGHDSRAELLSLLKSVHIGGARPPVKLVSGGVTPIRITSPHSGGYTLEAALGLMPNGKADPDFKGWEVKTFSGGRITVMTPEPDGGFYRAKGCEQFLNKYGLKGADSKLRYTGVHVVGHIQSKHKMNLLLDGYDQAANKIVNPGGALRLIDATGQEAASWSFVALVSHWSRKHAKAVYVPTENDGAGFSYLSPVWMCEGTDFSLFLQAMAKNSCCYDPGSSLAPVPPFAKKLLKARNQFRVTKAGISDLYKKAVSVPLT